MGVDTPAAPAAAAAATAQPDDDQRAYKLYNFRRPDKFSKDHLRALQTIHENFARQFALLLTAYLRMGIEMDVVSVDQLTYEEFVQSMPSPMTVIIQEMPPLTGQMLVGIGYEVTSSLIDRMLGGPGRSEPKARELTDIEQSLIRRVIDRSSSVMEESWRSVMGVKSKIIGIEDSYSLIQVTSPGEIVALITFEVRLGKRDSGLMSVCVPYPVLEPVINQLSAQHIFHSQTEPNTEDAKEKVLQKLGAAKIPVQVLLGGCQMSVRDLVDLAEGDVVRLSRGVHEDLLVCVNEKPKFLARPGTMKDRLAVVIADVAQDERDLEGFGIDGPR